MPEYYGGNGCCVPQFESWQKSEKRKIKQAGNWIGISFIGYLLVSMLASNIGYAIIYYLVPRAGLMVELSENIEQIIETVTYFFSLAIPFGIYIAVLKMPLPVAIPLKSAKFDLVVSGLFVGLGMSIIAEYINYFISVLSSFIGIELLMPSYDIPESGGTATVLYSVSLTIIAAIMEEIVFRGCIMQSLRRFGDDFALIVSSLVFGIFHLNLIQMPYAFILGICIGFFVMKSGSLWTGILIHLANNSIALLFDFLSKYVDEQTYIYFFYIHQITSVVLGVIFLIILALKYKKFFQLIPFHSGISAGRRVWYFISSPFLIIGFAVACYLTASYISF